MKTITSNLVDGKLYDRIKEHIYIKDRGGFIFGWEEFVKREKIETELELRISTEQMPDRVIVNGERYKLTKITPN